MSSMPSEQLIQSLQGGKSQVSYSQSDARILQVRAHHDFSSGHTLDLVIAKTSPGVDTYLSPKLFPLVVAMWETTPDLRRKDFYSFDNGGICLSHGYSETNGNQIIFDEEHDLDVGRLIEHGKVISQLIGNYNIPMPLLTHTTVMDLRANQLRE